MNTPTKQDVMLAAAEARNMQFFFTDEERKQYQAFLRKSDTYKQAARERANRQMPPVTQDSIDAGIEEMRQMIEKMGVAAIDKIISDADE